MKMFLNLLKVINPVEVIKSLKKSDKKTMTNGIFTMGGSGVLVTTGVTMVVDGSESMNKHQMAAGGFLVVVGAVLAFVLSKKVKEINDAEDKTND